MSRAQNGDKRCLKICREKTSTSIVQNLEIFVNIRGAIPRALDSVFGQRTSQFRSQIKLSIRNRAQRAIYFILMEFHAAFSRLGSRLPLRMILIWIRKVILKSGALAIQTLILGKQRCSGYPITKLNFKSDWFGLNWNCAYYFICFIHVNNKNAGSSAKIAGNWK